MSTQPKTNNLNYQLHAAYLIANKDFMEIIHSYGIYLTMIFSFLIAGFTIYTFTQIKDTSIIQKQADIIFNIILGIAFLYVAVSSVTSIAREKNEKTIEVLFYAPVDEISFIFGKYAGRVFTYIFMLIFSILFIVVSNFFVNLEISFDFVKKVVLSMFFISCVIALGIFLSNLTSSVGGSIVLLIGFFAILFILQIIASILAYIPTGFNQTVDSIRDIVVGILSATKYISPLEYQNIGMKAIELGDNVKFLLSIVYSIAYSVIFLILSIIVLMKKGIKQ